MILYNIDHQAAIVDPEQPGVRPGESYDFDPEAAEARLASGLWTETDPRRGLPEERAFKAARDAEPGDVEADTPQQIDTETAAEAAVNEESTE